MFLLSEEETRSLLERALGLAGCDAEVAIGGGRFAMARLAGSTIRQNVEEKRHHLSLRVYHKGRLGLTWVNQLDDEAIGAGWARAKAQAEICTGEEEHLPFPGPQTYPEVPGAFDPKIGEVRPDEIADLARRAIAVARREGLILAGEISIHEGATSAGYVFPHNWGKVFGVANTNGLFAYHRSTTARIYLRMMTPNSSGWYTQVSNRWDDLDAEAVAEEAAIRARQSQNPRLLPKGKYKAILEEPSWAGQAARQCWGGYRENPDWFLKDKVGQRVFGENVTIAEDPTHPLVRGCPFGPDGLPRKRVVLYEKGVHRNLIHDLYHAEKYGEEALGYAPPVPRYFAWDIHAATRYFSPLSNVVWEGKEEATLNEMLVEMGTGLLIRQGNPYERLVRNACWVEGGKIVGGLKRFMLEGPGFAETLNGAVLLGPHSNRSARWTLVDRPLFNTFPWHGEVAEESRYHVI